MDPLSASAWSDEGDCLSHRDIDGESVQCEPAGASVWIGKIEFGGAHIAGDRLNKYVTEKGHNSE